MSTVLRKLREAAGTLGFKFLQISFGFIDNAVRKAGELGNFNAVAVICSAADDLSEENKRTTLFFGRDVIVAYAVQLALQGRERKPFMPGRTGSVPPL